MRARGKRAPTRKPAVTGSRLQGITMSDENRKVIQGEVVGETPHRPHSNAQEGNEFWSRAGQTYTSHDQGQSYQAGHEYEYQRPRFNLYTVRTHSPVYAGAPTGSFITLVLFFTCLFQWGFLAALGFIFFYIICAGIGFYYNLRRMVSGYAPTPWLTRIVSWIVCLGLVSWLV